jgi:crossover junction endodeoxyribonuclease RuvC
MIILGIDPGFAITGFGVIEYRKNKFRFIEHGTINTKAGVKYPLRLLAIGEKIKELIDEHNPDAVAIEELFFNNNIKTAISAAQGRGAAILASAEKNMNIFEYTPLQVKQAVTGYGRADKKQMQQMVKIILNLKEIPRPDDAADALGVAICHAHSFRLGGRD